MLQKKKDVDEYKNFAKTFKFEHDFESNLKTSVNDSIFELYKWFKKFNNK